MSSQKNLTDMLKEKKEERQPTQHSKSEQVKLLFFRLGVSEMVSCVMWLCAPQAHAR